MNPVGVVVCFFVVLGSAVVPAVGFEVDVDVFVDIVFVAAVLMEGSLEEVVLAGVNTLPAGVGADRNEFGEDVMLSVFPPLRSNPKMCFECRYDAARRNGSVQASEDEVG